MHDSSHDDDENRSDVYFSHHHTQEEDYSINSFGPRAKKIEKSSSRWPQKWLQSPPSWPLLIRSFCFKKVPKKSSFFPAHIHTPHFFLKKQKKLHECIKKKWVMEVHKGKNLIFGQTEVFSAFLRWFIVRRGFFFHKTFFKKMISKFSVKQFSKYV